MKLLITLLFLSTNTFAFLGNFGFLNKQTKKETTDYLFFGKTQFATVITKDNVDFYTTGLNDAHQLCLGNNNIRYSFMNSKITKNSIKEFQGTSTNVCIIDSSDVVHCCGKNSRGESALGNFNNYTPSNNWFNTGLSNIISLSGYNGGSAEGGFVAIKTDGSVYVWGSNDTGRFLTGDTTNINTPLQIVSPGSDYIQASLGVESLCLRKTDGTVHCGGLNTNGQLGDGTTTSRNTLSQVISIPPVVDIDSGSSHYCARTASKDLYCWGYNNNGQLADGTVLPRSTPLLIATGVDDFQMGKNFTMILKSGDVYFAGENSNGQFGIGSISSVNTSLIKNNLITTGSILSIYASSNSSCIKTSQGVKCSGHNSVGTLGNGSSKHSYIYKEIYAP